MSHPHFVSRFGPQSVIKTLTQEEVMKPKIIDVEIDAKVPALTRLGASQADFANALDDALEALASNTRVPRPRPEDIPLWICGQRQRLGDVAAIRFALG
jgi:hypothetical protein